MKRRVASLPPVSLTIFNEKLLERKQETAVMLSPKGSTCEICKWVSLPLDASKLIGNSSIAKCIRPRMRFVRTCSPESIGRMK